MPIYTYNCTACGETTERRQAFSDAPLTTCESCGGALRKVIHPVGIVFKGSGWYVTDSRKSNSQTSKPAASKESGSDSEKKPAAEGTATAESAPKKTEASKADGASTAPKAPAPASTSG